MTRPLREAERRQASGDTDDQFAAIRVAHESRVILVDSDIPMYLVGAARGRARVAPAALRS